MRHALIVSAGVKHPSSNVLTKAYSRDLNGSSVEDWVLRGPLNASIRRWFYLLLDIQSVRKWSINNIWRFPLRIVCKVPLLCIRTFCSHKHGVKGAHMLSQMLRDPLRNNPIASELILIHCQVKAISHLSRGDITLIKFFGVHKLAIGPVDRLNPLFRSALWNEGDEVY